MTKINIYFGILAFSLMFYNCTSNVEDNTNHTSHFDEVQEVEVVLNKEELIAIADTKRLLIEGLKLVPAELTTENLSDKIKQKWSKIHFFVQNGLILKIETFPYEGVSTITEAFYADESGLFLLVVESNEEEENGNSKDKLDKRYYFSEEELILEFSNGSETEFSASNNDVEEFLSEFKEYQEILLQKEK